VRIEERDDGDGKAWELENGQLAVRLERAGLALTVTDKRCGKQWRMEPERDGFLIQRYGIQVKRPLEELPLEEWREVREGRLHGVELMSVCPDPWIQYNVRIRVLLAEDAPELALVVAPHEDPGYVDERWIRELYWPRSFEHSASGAARTVLPFQQGTLLPGDWPAAVVGERAMNTFHPWGFEACTGPWWGHLDEGGAGYLAVIETPDDATFDFAHPAGGPTRIAPRWLTSFEAFRYPRRMLYRFFDDADHVDVALGYRDWCRAHGRWRSVQEKRLEKPQLDKLLGAIGVPQGGGRVRPWVRAYIVSLRREGVSKSLRTFSEICDLLDRTAEEHPDENVWVTLSGWQVLGYDHAHPAACPPAPEAGGWEGMRRVGETAARHGFLFGVHDQYRDFYYSSPFWSEELTLKDSRRDSPRHHYWAGGTQSILCPALMLDFVKMNVQQLRDQHIGLNATYQDVLTAIPLEECYDHLHPVTRTQCREARNAVFEYYRELGWLISSESASDWAAPALDSIRVHWARAGGGLEGEPLGIPVPLFSLVFGDCAVMASSAVPALIAALAGVNTLQPEDRLLRRLHAATAYMPLTAHALCSKDGQQQESVFGDRVRVWADLSTGAYRVSGLDGEGEVEGELRDGHM
jgi:hypothetical protein